MHTCCTVWKVTFSIFKYFFYRYLCEYAIKYRNVATLVSLDDKHQVKCGKPGYPVAAVDQGKQVIVQTNKRFKVADHDFTKVTLIPSVQMFIEVPELCSYSSKNTSRTKKPKKTMEGSQNFTDRNNNSFPRQPQNKI